MLGGRKCRCRGTHFGNDLLRRIHTQAGYFRQPLDRILMLAEQSSPSLGPVGRSAARSIATPRAPSSAAGGRRG